MLGESGHKDAWKAWKSGKRPLYPATLSVTVEPVAPPHGSEPALRSMLATQVIFSSCFYHTLIDFKLHPPLQPEGGQQEVQDVLGEELGANDILVWSRLPGQSCKVINKQMQNQNPQRVPDE